MLAIQAAASPTKAGTIPIVADTDATLFKKYGMVDIDLERMLTMCRLKSGQEDRFPDWIETVATTGLSKEGKKTTIRKTLLTDPRYDKHPIPITLVLLKMIADKEFAGDDDHTTAAGAMKGLSPYTIAGMTADEIVEANEYAQALEELRAATVVAEIRKKHARKAHSPLDFTDLLDMIKTYANLLQALFGRRCWFLKELVDDMILPLQRFKPIARKLMARTTLASIMWGLSSNKHASSLLD